LGVRPVAVGLGTSSFQSFCPVSSKKFNIKSALSIHQSQTLPQKIDSREGLF